MSFEGTTLANLALGQDGEEHQYTTEVTNEEQETASLSPGKRMRTREFRTPNQQKQKSSQPSSPEAEDEQKRERGDVERVLCLKKVDNSATKEERKDEGYEEERHEQVRRQEEEIKTEDEQSSEKVTEDEGTLEVKEKSKIKLPPRKTILIFALVLLIISGVVIGITLDLQRESQQTVKYTLRYPSSSNQYISTQGIEIKSPNLFGSDKSFAIAHIVKPNSMNMGNARLLQEDTEGLPTDITESITAVINYYYGVIDFVDSQKGIVLRYLTSTNFILYIFSEKLLAWFYKTYPKAQKSITEDELSNASAKLIASIKKLDQFQIEIKKEEVWIGTINDQKEFTIETESMEASYGETEETQSSTDTEANNLNNEDGQKTAEDLVNTAIKQFYVEKASLVSKYSHHIAKSLEISFGKDTDLLLISEKQETLGSNQDDNGEEEYDMEKMMYQQYLQKGPTIFTKVYEAILAERPSSLEEVKTINKETYTSIISCTDEDSTTKACTTEEWKNHDSPFVRTQESVQQEPMYKTFKRLRISIKSSNS